MNSHHLAFRFLFFAVLLAFLTGCPRLAYIDVYNNTTSVFRLNSHGEIHTIKPAHSVRVNLGCSLQIESELGVWKYLRAVPHGGDDGPYFDGTLRTQIDVDGVMYALRRGQHPPISGFFEQPYGFPVHANQFAYMEVYNNTASAFLLNSDGGIHTVNPAQSVRVISGPCLQIESELGIWRYQQAVPHGGDDGPYFDGTLRVQINVDGAMYALKAGAHPPIFDLSEQPHGFPNRPTGPMRK